MRLNAGFVRTVKKPGRYGDGHGSYGLALVVRPRAAGGVRRAWTQRVIINGRPTNLGLGAYPVVTLSEARRKAIKNRRAIEQGVDPRRGGVPTFAEAAEQVIQMNRAGWKPGASTEGRWRSSLTNYAFPVIGDKPVDQVTTGDLLAVLSPIWLEKPAVARFLKQRIAAVMRWCVAQGYRADNPAADALTAALPKQNGNTRHQKALPHAEVGDALIELRQAGATNPTVALALELQILTAARPTEARCATWNEINRDTKTWTIPPERMKAKLEHRVPLSTAALDVLAEAATLTGRTTGLVFPNRNGRPHGAGVTGTLLRRAGVDAVPHGFRSSFRVWCEEIAQAPRSISEAALAHVNRNEVEAAYLRSDLFDRRRELMEQWAAYLGLA